MTWDLMLWFVYAGMTGRDQNFGYGLYDGCKQDAAGLEFFSSA